MLEVFKLVAMACALAPGGHGVDSSFPADAATHTAARFALSLQLSCQQSLTLCVGNEPPSPAKWVECLVVAKTAMSK
jgi:hypothetical protein